MNLERRACYRALQARDPRFDGRFFSAVRTTGIYCRPICPARTPRLENVEFFATPAAAQEAGFRPCLRCRPESSPELAAWRGSSDTVARALALIAAGRLDDGGSVAHLAARLGIGERQLRRLFRRHLGAAPVAVAQTRRVLFAKQLIHETSMGMTDVALAAGFGSVRRFNETFSALFGRPPTALRTAAATGRAGGSATGSRGITLRLPFAGPYDWPAMTGFLAGRAIPGVEAVGAGSYRRTVAIGGRHGTIEVRPAAVGDALEATIVFPDVRALPDIVGRIRRVFDLAADLETITADLARDPWLAPLVAVRPGLRVPGAWDGFELATRAILGQQITVAGARELAGRLVARCGVPLAVDGPGDGLTSAFPPPERLAGEDLASLGMPRARARALSGLAAAAAADPTLFEPRQGLERVVARLRTLPGIGDWTAQYIAMRAIGEPDAFPAADVGLLKAATPPGGTRPTADALTGRAEAWRPWRAYAVMHLWASLRPQAAAITRPAGEAVA